MVAGSIPPLGSTAAAADRSETAGGLHQCNLHNLEKNTNPCYFPESNIPPEEKDPKILHNRASSQNRSPSDIKKKKIS